MDVQQPKHAEPPKGSSAIFDCIFQLQEFDTSVPVDHTESHPPHRSPTRCCQPDLGIRLTSSAAPAKTCEHTHHACSFKATSLLGLSKPFISILHEATLRSKAGDLMHHFMKTSSANLSTMISHIKHVTLPYSDRVNRNTTQKAQYPDAVN